MKKKPLYIFSLVFILSFISLDADAQCSMCKAVAESATDEHGNHTAGGINAGIIYMMGVPYLLLGFLALVFFRERIKSFIQDFRSIHS
jgi:hypothetical protein